MLFFFSIEHYTRPLLIWCRQNPCCFCVCALSLIFQFCLTDRVHIFAMCACRSKSCTPVHSEGVWILRSWLHIGKRCWQRNSTQWCLRRGGFSCFCKKLKEKGMMNFQLSTCFVSCLELALVWLKRRMGKETLFQIFRGQWTSLLSHQFRPCPIRFLSVAHANHPPNQQKHELLLATWFYVLLLFLGKISKWGPTFWDISN